LKNEHICIIELKVVSSVFDNSTFQDLIFYNKFMFSA